MLQSGQELANELSHSLLVFDTCFVLSEEFPEFLRSFGSILERNPPVLLDRVENEIEFLTDSSRIRKRQDECAGKSDSHVTVRSSEEIEQVVQEAQRGKRLIEELDRSGGIRRVKTSCRAHGDAAILAYALEERLHRDVCVLTNERNLTQDLYDLTRQKSVDSSHLFAVAGFRGGKFGIWEDPYYGKPGWFSSFVLLNGELEKIPARSDSSCHSGGKSWDGKVAQAGKEWGRKFTRKAAEKIFSDPQSNTRQARIWKRWGIFCSIALLTLPLLAVKWFGLDGWEDWAFGSSVVLTLLFLHYAAFLLMVFLPLTISWFFSNFVPMNWSLPSLVILGFWITYRFAGKHGELLRPGGPKSLFKILWRQFFH